MSVVAKVYAKALFESATGTSAAGLDKIQTQLSQFVAALKSSKDLQVMLYAPITTGKEKASITQALADKMGTEPVLSKFLVLVANKDRMNALPEILEEFSAVRIAAEGGLQGRVVAAEAIGDADVASLSQAFTKKLGRKVSFNVSTDPSLLAGVKVTVNGVTYDGTLKSQLERLRDRMLSIHS